MPYNHSSAIKQQISPNYVLLFYLHMLLVYLFLGNLLRLAVPQTQLLYLCFGYVIRTCNVDICARFLDCKKFILPRKLNNHCDVTVVNLLTSVFDVVIPEITPKAFKHFARISVHPLNLCLGNSRQTTHISSC
jgi:hypothetical protein